MPYWIHEAITSRPHWESGPLYRSHKRRISIMQALTISQVRSLQTSADSMWDALILVEDTFCHTADRVLVALTSDRAIKTYRTAWAISKYTCIPRQNSGILRRSSGAGCVGMAQSIGRELLGACGG